MSFEGMSAWRAPKGVRLPDFIICGAMKCGTTTVHSLLNSHPRISVAEEEIHFYDIDDHLEHGDFVFLRKDAWAYPDVKKDPTSYWKWYSKFFEGFPEENLIGEDSTGYLPSEKALQRISIQDKPTKIIVCLRNPTSRAYSQYYHLLRSGRVLFNFEDTVLYTPDFVLRRSMYFEQVKRLLNFIPREQVFFFVLEEFIADATKVTKTLMDFIGEPFDDLPAAWMDTHSNVGGIPRFPQLQVSMNRLLRRAVSNRYLNHLPISDYAQIGEVAYKIDLGTRLVNRAHKMINPIIDAKPPKMKANTRAYLDQYFKRELEGLDELIGIPVVKKWFPE